MDGEVAWGKGVGGGVAVGAVGGGVAGGCDGVEGAAECEDVAHGAVEARVRVWIVALAFCCCPLPHGLWGWQRGSADVHFDFWCWGQCAWGRRGRSIIRSIR